MDKPHIAATSPIMVELEPDKSYFYCTCGLSAKQPFCDGSHQGTGFTPSKFSVEEAGEHGVMSLQANRQPTLL